MASRRRSLSNRPGAQLRLPPPLKQSQGVRQSQPQLCLAVIHVQPRPTALTVAFLVAL
jgi:hypothetical protein